MKVEAKGTTIQGCFELKINVHADARGSFLKTFHLDTFRHLGLRTDWAEEFYSVSRKGVLRGMHYQKPPFQHAKLVYCLSGKVLDVVLDLRRESPTYGQTQSFLLSSGDGTAVYMPEGVAHGFYSLEDGSGLYYKVTSMHSPEHDAGISWDSFGFPWPSQDPILSERDKGFPSFREIVPVF
jgi:dTDP-4-dehydrorhamnose 3,5-epimerase